MCQSKWIMLALVLLPAAAARGQYMPYGPANVRPDPHTVWVLRERAVVYAGGGMHARAFVANGGGDAVAVIFACSPAGARRLVWFYASGNLEMLPRPRELLRVISMPGHGDFVVAWVTQGVHAKMLMDVDHFDAFVISPLEYVCGQKSLEQGATEVRERRLAAQAAVTPQTQPMSMSDTYFVPDMQTLCIIGIVLAVVALWWKRRQSGGFGVYGCGPGARG